VLPTQLLGFINEASVALERGGQQDLLVLDFSKAFDSVSHSLLIHKLRHYGICGKVNSWIASFLSNRQQSVLVNGERSASVAVDSGVPQGSMLGPSLFLLYINDLPEGLSSTARLFADDTACHKDVNNVSDQERFQEDLDTLASWEQRWKMLFHPQKCSVVHLTRCRQILHFDYQLHSHKLQTESQVKYPGVTISNDLRWSHHINNISARANRTLGFLRRNIKLNCKSIKESAYKA
jgi:hypothetical protein